MTSVGGFGMGLFQKTFMARMDGGKMDQMDFPFSFTTYFLKWSRWISSLLHNIFLTSPRCPNVIQGKHISHADHRYFWGIWKPYLFSQHAVEMKMDQKMDHNLF